MDGAVLIAAAGGAAYFPVAFLVASALGRRLRDSLNDYPVRNEADSDKSPVVGWPLHDGSLPSPRLRVLGKREGDF